MVAGGYNNNNPMWKKWKSRPMHSLWKWRKGKSSGDLI